MQRFVPIRALITYVISIILLYIILQKLRGTFIPPPGRLCGKSPYLKKRRQYISYFIQILKLLTISVLLSFEMTFRKRNNYSVCN